MQHSSNHIMKQLGILLLLSFVSVTLFAQKNITFTVSTNASKVVKGGIFEVVFSIKNGIGQDFQPPNFKGFEIIRGPSIRSKQTIINGKGTRSINYSYDLKGLEIGKLTIASATVKVNKRIYKTKPLKVDIRKPPSKSELANTKDLFIRTDLDVETAYVGQQVIATFTIFSTKKILKAELVDVPKFSNGFTQYLNISQFSSRIEIYNGKQYFTVPAARYMVIPHKSGDLTVKDLEIELKVADNNDFFSTVANKNIWSDEVTLNVIPLENQPDDFTNAVGEFEFDAILTKSELSMDESSTLTISITGTGDMKAVQIPKLKALETHFEVYEPTVNSVVQGETSRLISQKVFTYLLVPKKIGTLNYKPTFTYFDTNTNSFETLKKDEIDIRIKNGNGENGNDEISDFTNDGERDIQTIFSTTNFQNGKPSLFGSGLFWTLITLPFLALLITFGIKQRRQKEANINPILTKRSKADKIAMQHLAKAETYWKQNEKRAFYEETSKALWGYVCDKLTIPQAELSKENIRSKLVEKEVGDNNIDQFIQVLNACEMAVFAKLGTDMETIYKDAKSVISVIEETLKR